MRFTVHFTVTLSEPLPDDQFVFVTGNAEQLGQWDPQRAFRLQPTPQRHWTGSVSVGIGTVKFRYFVGYYLESEPGAEPTLIVARWETHLTPRCVIPAVESTKEKVCRANVNDVFGFHGGKEVVSNGWLRQDNQILLRFFGSAIKFYKARHEQPRYRLRVRPVDLRHREEGDEEEEAEEPRPSLPSFGRPQIAALTQKDPHFRDQAEQGELFENQHDYLIYRTQSVADEFLGFRLEVLAADGAAEGGAVLGSAYALPSSLAGSCGHASVPLLTAKGLPVGKLHFGYLFVRPIALPVPAQDMRASYTKHWKKRNTLEVGHRGMGNSYTKTATARENTLHSLNSAARRGADYVEFDVHLTKDKVPIIFHDFHVLVSVAKRTPSLTDLRKLSAQENGQNGVDAHELAVKDLTLSQLRLLHVEEAEEQTNFKVTGHRDEEEAHQPFPTLRDSFHSVSEEVGFNVEVKYPMGLLQGGHECENYFEPNEFLDIILAEVLNHAGQRRIMFSSFDPDICLMLALKQNKYPVLFLNQGASVKHPPYSDPRTQTSELAVRFVAGTGLVGVNFNSEDLLRDPEPVNLAKQFGLISFVWGDELADKDVVDYFKKTLGVDGVIYDRIGEAESRSNVFLLERAMKQALFGNPPPRSPKQQQHRFLSNGQVDRPAPAALARPPTTSAALEHLDLPTLTQTRVQWPGAGLETSPGAGSVHSSTSSGFSTDASALSSSGGSSQAHSNGLKRQHNSFSHGFYPGALSSPQEI